MKMGEMFNQKG